MTVRGRGFRVMRGCPIALACAVGGGSGKCGCAVRGMSTAVTGAIGGDHMTRVLRRTLAAVGAPVGRLCRPVIASILHPAWWRPISLLSPGPLLLIGVILTSASIAALPLVVVTIPILLLLLTLHGAAAARRIG